MRVLLATVFAGFLLAACQTPCPAPETGPVTTRLTCEDGSDLTVTFTRNPDLARIEEEGYTTLTLPARIAGAGYTYSGGGAELRRRGAETTWTRPGAAATVCGDAPANGARASHEPPRQALSMGPSSRCPSGGFANLLQQRMGTSAS